MTATGPVLVTEQLSRSDRLDLLELLPSGAAEERWAELAPGELGEPALAALAIALTPMVLSAISAWLATRGKDVEVRFSAEGLGVKAGFSFSAKNGDTADDLARRAAAGGAEVGAG
jgi:hypothetical protein